MFNPDRLKGGSALVIGAGRSGVACANLLAARGFRVTLTDAKPAEAIKANLKGLSRRVRVEAGRRSGAVPRCDFAVKSPGIPRGNPLIKGLLSRKIPVFSEVQTALAFSRAGRFLAVTGTNGKTTATVLLGEIMKSALRHGGGRALVCGNVGVPAALAAPKAGPRDAVIMEVSSYQLEDSTYFHPDAACVLNVTPDHLDHHGGLAAYVAAKKKIFSSQKQEDFCVFNYEDPVCRRLAKACPSRTRFFSSRRKGRGLDAWAQGGDLFFRNGRKIFRVKAPALPGAHNLENAMAAGLMAMHCGASRAALARTFASFRGVEHRIERAGTVRGITFFNDSKATNVQSAAVALKALGGSRNIWLILGGQGKGTPYAPLAPLVGKSVRGVLTIGEDARRIESELAGCAPVITSLTMQNACREILQLGEPGDIALFSPACASFDQFRDFEDRGRKFKAFVKSLVRKGRKG